MPLPDGRELLLVHGSPADPTVPITHDMTDDEVAASWATTLPISSSAAPRTCRSTATVMERAGDQRRLGG
jgi:hypothetical protein